jgi:hypothetical protein
MALYLTGDAEVAGPVRSLRHYFAWIAAEYAADVVHVGSSPQGYAWRQAMSLGYLDDTYGDPGFWRVPHRAAPHNDYTNTAADRKHLLARNRQHSGSWAGLLFRQEGALREQGVPDSSVSLTYRGGYSVRYDYDAGSDRYLRTMDGYPHVDALDGRRIAPAAVIVQFAETSLIPGDTAGRLDMNLESEGDFLLFADGFVQSGRWKRPSLATHTRWMTQDGRAVVLPPGPVWIQIVPLDSTIAY